MDILKDLNENQKLAATHIDGPMLILAGAGSGKTKTITSRLAYLLSNGVDPASTLTLTFTNKAASEMRLRAYSLIGDLKLPLSPLLCTFHKFGLLFLKFYINKLNRKNNFIIIDTDDKKKILKSFDSDIPTALIASEISKYKNALLKPDKILQNISIIGDEVANRARDFYQKISLIYKKYCDYEVENNLVDFDDLLVLSYEILDNFDEIANETSSRFNFITVDEYQDTNEIQFKLLKKLCKLHENLVVVGDDDQSIYGWRGARIENILNFKDEFKNVKLIKLEENYRSTPEILKAANELIGHNRNRLGKNLKSTVKPGESIAIMESNDEIYEANKIADKIKTLLQSGIKAENIAVLYRINALSRSIEEGLNRANIPYKMVGGMKFYERAEIKDIIAYLRLLITQDDDFSLRRIINRPKRGIGKVSLANLESFAYKNRLSLFDSIGKISTDIATKKVCEALEELYNGILKLSNMNTTEKLENLEKTFKIKEYYAALPDGADKVANIDEFYATLKDNAKNDPEFDLNEFLNEITLLSEADAITNEAISVMSIHASKGLEFDHLFVIGLEEGFFPLLGDSCDIEEERRLAYVAITRAKKSLTLSYVESRFFRGKREKLEKSRFLSEAGLCGGSLVLEEKGEFKKGDLIKHKLFGIGRIIATAKVRNEQKLTINFGGIKRDILSSFVERVI